MSKIKIELNNLQETFEINGVKYGVFRSDQLADLLNTLSENKADFEELKKAVIAILNLLGLLDPETQTIKQSLKDGSENYLKPIMKSMARILGLMGSPFSSSKKQLAEEFAFIKTLLPFIDKHGRKS